MAARGCQAQSRQARSYLSARTSRPSTSPKLTRRPTVRGMPMPGVTGVEAVGHEDRRDGGDDEGGLALVATDRDWHGPKGDGADLARAVTHFEPPATERHLRQRDHEADTEAK